MFLLYAHNSICTWMHICRRTQLAQCTPNLPPKQLRIYTISEKRAPISNETDSCKFSNTYILTFYMCSKHKICIYVIRTLHSSHIRATLYLYLLHTIDIYIYWHVPAIQLQCSRKSIPVKCSSLWTIKLVGNNNLHNGIGIAGRVNKTH